MRIAALLTCCACLVASDLLPGWPIPLPAVALPDPAWRKADGALLALDATGAVRWRLALSPGCQLWPGEGGVLLADDHGLRWLGPDQETLTLPPLPGDVQPLGVDRGIASFAQERVGWLLDPRSTAKPERIVLGGEALGPALADGQESLWLTMHELVHSESGVRTVQRHGLAAGRGWRLARDRQARPLVLAPDGRAWRLPPWQAGADDERLGRPLLVTADAPRDLRMREALRRRDWDAAETLAVGTAEHAALAMYALRPVPPGAGDLSPLPRDPAETTLPEAGWSGGQAPRARPAVIPSGPPAGCDRDRPLLDSADTWPEEAEAQRTIDGLVLGMRSWQVEDDGERATASCRDDGTLRWYTRWLPEPGLGAPARFLALSQGCLLVGEGDARLLILDLGDGTVHLDARLRRLPVLPGRTWPRGDGAVILHPPGRDDHLGWIAADGSETDELLAASARWVVTLPDGEVWLSLQDGRTVAGSAPGAWRPITLPAELAGARSARLVEGGVAAGVKRWAWRTH
jgi:hypothetical protein